MRKLICKLLKITDLTEEVKKLKAEVDRWTQTTNEANDREIRALEHSKKAKNQKNKAIKELKEHNIKVRKQNEADLFFISAKIQKKLLDGEKKDSPTISVLRQQQIGLERAGAAQGDVFDRNTLRGGLEWRY